MTTLRRLSPAKIAWTIIAAPLALALGACGGETEGGAVDGDPISAIPAPDGQAWTDVVQVTEEDGYLLGNPDAPLKLIEYASLTCGACANFAQTGASPLKEEYVSTGVVSYELRNLVRDGYDLTLARLTRCGAPESFHPLSDQVWLNFDQIMNGAQQGQQAMQQLGDLPDNQIYVAVAETAGFLDFFASRGISRDQAASCLSDNASVLAIGERSDTQAGELGITSTPTFILNGRQLDERSWTDLEPVLQRAGAREE
ncbi:thioredoxin domain-containing protein [Aurantiacibacter marinus]|uniref:Protein-disulfide isomerase n=1 Tax=Aurantiacibacter marinus TaxID=874156 RepID=A0A0H0XLL1_9SPHN|nr:thioredoxin domain-containing protein [Aurantiacibacter marinus]KLI63478.1 protein-disulfide isomerase [Aurantiacibacter marinus]